MDIFCSTGQFANLIDVSPGNTFKVNGETISTDWSPAAVVEVEITQQADGIQMSLVRSVDGVPNLTYTTNILNPESATGVSMYCGGYTCAPEDNVNYAIFMNDLQIAGEHKLRISHCLAALPGQSVNEIKEVMSHPIALMQCEDFLDKRQHSGSDGPCQRNLCGHGRHGELHGDRRQSDQWRCHCCRQQCGQWPHSDVHSEAL